MLLSCSNKYTILKFCNTQTLNPVFRRDTVINFYLLPCCQPGKSFTISEIQVWILFWVLPSSHCTTSKPTAINRSCMQKNKEISFYCSVSFLGRIFINPFISLIRLCCLNTEITLLIPANCSWRNYGPLGIQRASLTFLSSNYIWSLFAKF